jgi:predicted transcriptional regulator YdeE
MSTKKLNSFYIIGISVKTTNANNQAATDIGSLWQKFISENIASKIPNKIGETVYAVYCRYESDYTAPYTTLLGCKVNSVENIPDGFDYIEIAEGNYEQFVSKGNLMEGAVYKTWVDIWNGNLSRAYTTDFEVYDEKSADPSNAMVDIFIALVK